MSMCLCVCQARLHAHPTTMSPRDEAPVTIGMAASAAPGRASLLTRLGDAVGTQALWEPPRAPPVPSTNDPTRAPTPSVPASSLDALKTARGHTQKSFTPRDVGSSSREWESAGWAPDSVVRDAIWQCALKNEAKEATVSPLEGSREEGEGLSFTGSINSLVAMGFGRVEATRALAKAQGCLKTAAETLGQTHIPPPNPAESASSRQSPSAAPDFTVGSTAEGLLSGDKVCRGTGPPEVPGLESAFGALTGAYASSMKHPGSSMKERLVATLEARRAAYSAAVERSQSEFKDRISSHLAQMHNQSQKMREKFAAGADQAAPKKPDGSEPLSTMRPIDVQPREGKIPCDAPTPDSRPATFTRSRRWSGSATSTGSSTSRVPDPKHSGAAVVSDASVDADQSHGTPAPSFLDSPRWKAFEVEVQKAEMTKRDRGESSPR